MSSRTDAVSGHTTLAVDVSPDVVDAGAEVTVRGKVSCVPACDLRGHALLIKDQTGADAGRAELTEFDGVTNATRDIVVKAPVTPGTYSWSAVCPAAEKGGVSYAEASTPLSLTVKPHTTNVVVWDVPPAIVVGERFKIKVGIKCSHECSPAGWDVRIYDHEGSQAATGTLPGERWPGTTGLHVAEVELEAPADEGLYTWSVKGPSDTAIPHAEGAANIGMRVVSRPECLVTIEALDKESQTPLSGARVVMHPYRAVTDERGVAEVRVAKGVYQLFVSQTRYLTFGLPVEVNADMTTRAEMHLEPVQERN